MKKVIVMMGTAGLIACGVQGAVVAGWEVENIDVAAGVGIVTNSPPFTFLATTQQTGIAIAQLQLGSGVNPSSAMDQYGFKIAKTNQTVSLASAIALNHYIEFSLTVASGYVLNLQQITMKGEATSTGCSNVVLMCSIDGFIAGQEIASASSVTNTGGFDTDASGFGGPIDLSAARYQNLTGTVTFRLYGWNSTSGSGVTYLRNLAGNDLVVSGEVVAMPAQPESPVLSLSLTNGTVYVSATLEEGSTTNYVIQCCSHLASSDWQPVSAPFATSTVWIAETTNSCGFFRVVPAAP